MLGPQPSFAISRVSGITKLIIDEMAYVSLTPLWVLVSNDGLLLPHSNT